MIEGLSEKILEAKAKLGEKNADIIAELMHMEKYNASRKVGCCPNPSHYDENPSCSYNPKTYSFYCFGCGYNIDIIDSIMLNKRTTFIEACEILFKLAGLNYNFVEKGAICRNYNYPKPSYSSNKDKVYKYWETRGISKETIDYLGIREDIDGNTLFEYYDLNDVLTMVKVRKSKPAQKGENKIWCLPGADTKHLLYNINKINISQPLLIVTGEGDCAAAIEAGFLNTVSIPFGDKNLQFVTEYWEYLQQFNEIIIVHDNDDSGEIFAKEMSRRLGEYRVKIVDIPPVFTDNEGRKIKIKDLNQLLVTEGKEAVRNVVLNAKESDIDCVVDYCDVDDFDMSDVPGFKTGFGDLDRLLDKIYMGTTTIITGSGGSGKTSFLSTIIAQSVDQGFPCFVFSGELNNPLLKSWVNFVHCGQRYINKYQGDSDVYYKVKDSARKKINEFYKGSLWFYRDGFDSKASSLFKTMETMVRKRGVKTIIIDNMTVVDLETDDNNKWNKQEDFIREIVDFSKKWQVACILVLHPKKMDTMRRMTVFDLQGVATATNIAHRVLSLYRVTDKDKQGVMNKKGEYTTKPIKFDVILDCLKDRFGTGQNKAVGLYYDVPSKRFFITEAELDHQYSWDNGTVYDTPLPYGIPQFEEEREVYGTLTS